MRLKETEKKEILKKGRWLTRKTNEKEWTRKVYSQREI